MRSETSIRHSGQSSGQTDLAWSVPVMRVGFAGRGVVYLAVASLSLYAIWQGGRAEGTSQTLAHLENSVIGSIVLVLIGIGMLAFAVWCAVDAYYDLDDCGSNAKGIATRIGIAVSGVVAVGIGGAALLLLAADIDGSGVAADAARGVTASGAGSGGSRIDQAVATVMGWPAGRWLIGFVGLAIVASGIFQFVIAAKGTYRRRLIANRFTRRWGWVLKAGVIGRGVLIGVVGLLFVLAAWRSNPYEAGGVDEAFGWLTEQPYGWVVAAAICVGLLGYALFCFVNAAYRFVAKVAGGDIETLAARAKAKLRLAT